MQNTSCNEFEAAHRHAVETRSEIADETLRQHARECVACGASAVDDAVIRQSMPDWLAAVPLIDFTGAVVTDWLSERETATGEILVVEPKPSTDETISNTRPGMNRRGVWITVVASACMLALAVLFGGPAEAPRNTDTATADLSPNIEPTTKRVETAPSPTTQPPEFSGLARKVGSAYLGLADRMGDTLSDAAGIIPKVSFPTDPLATSVDPKPLGNVEKRAGWTREFQPIGTKVGNAFAFLLDAIPMSDPMSDPKSM